MTPDTLRLNDLAKQYGLTFRRIRSTYIFDDFTAHGLRQALGYVEGYDRAMQTVLTENEQADA